ncbi:MAG: GNAT family N-acetyltransferase [Lentisphaeria bacterium]|nr:GNAT family N-acetyltransferase [Lentisphaeria bacterium]
MADQNCTAKEWTTRRSDAGELVLRECSADDLKELQQLSERVKWNQLPADWLNFLNAGKVWSMVHINRIVGTAAWIPRSKNCVWIGLVITLEEWRGCSIATRLMKKIIEQTSQYSSRLLDASAMGEPVYRRLGFKDMYQVSRIAIENYSAKVSPGPDWQPMTQDDVAELGKDDPLLPMLFENAPELCKVAFSGNKRIAWFMGRYGLNSIHLGPVYAEDVSGALGAVNEFKRLADGRKITLDAMGYQKEFLNALYLDGAQNMRDFTRMYHGRCDRQENPQMFAAAGPEYG